MSIKITILLPDGRRQPIEIPEHTTLQRFMPAFAQKVNLPRRDETGTAVAYYTTHEANDDPIPDDVPLADCNVHDGDTLVLHPITVPDPHETIDLDLEPEAELPSSAAPARHRQQQRPPSPLRRRIVWIGCLIFIFLCCTPAACLTLLTSVNRSRQEAIQSKPVIIEDEALANTTLFNFAVLDAEFSHTANKLVMVSTNPPQVHLFDVSFDQDFELTLMNEPTAVTISQDGLTVAIAQEMHVTLVDLTTERITHELDTTAVPHDIVLADNGWIYLTTENRIHAVSIAENREIVSAPLPSENTERVIRLSGDGRFLYSTTRGSSPATLDKFDITQTVPRLVENVNDNPDSRGNLWLYPTITQAITSRSQIYRLSDNATEDRQLLGDVFSSEGQFIQAMSQMNRNQQVLAITTNNPSEIRVMDTIGWIQTDVISLPEVRLDDEVVGGNGRYIFTNPNNLQYHVLFTINDQWGIFTGNLSS